MKIPAGLWAEFRLTGADPAMMVRRARLPLAVIAEGRDLNTEQYFELWEQVPELTGNPAAGIVIASQIETTAMPSAFLAAHFARDF